METKSVNIETVNKTWLVQNLSNLYKCTNVICTDYRGTKAESLFNFSKWLTMSLSGYHWMYKAIYHKIRFSTIVS